MTRSLSAVIMFCAMFATSFAQKFTISGYVTDRKTSETLINAIVLDKISHGGIATNSFGFYSLTLPKGRIDLAFSYPGYASKSVCLDLQKDTVINLQLDMKEQQNFKTAYVYGSAKAGIMATGMGAVNIPVQLIKHTPSLLGETDVMRTLQLEPGVQSGIGGTTGIYVRGGNADENLILLDGAPLYKADHLFGIFSVFTPEAVKKATFYKGSFPARYTGRLSSIIDVRTKDGDMQHYHGAFSLGLLSSRFNIEGPLVKNKTSFSFSARRSYVDLPAKLFMSKNHQISYYIQDINAKINHRFSEKDRIYLSYYEGKDNFYAAESFNNDDPFNYSIKMNWGNRVASLRWNHVFSDKLFANATAYCNRYEMIHKNHQHLQFKKGNAEDDRSKFLSGIQDWSGQMNFDYYPISSHHITFGANYIYHQFEPMFSSTVETRTDNEGANPERISNSTPKENWQAHEASAYAEDNWRINNYWQADLGFAASLFKIKGKQYIAPQPRLSLRYQPLTHLVFKAAYTCMTQFIHQLSSGALSLPTDMWAPITNHIRPMNAAQYSLGAYYTGLPSWEFSIELYQKQMKNLLDFKDGMSFIGFSYNWENMVGTGIGRARGIEFLIRKTQGRSTGQLAYTLSESRRKFSKESGINAGEWYPDRFDRRHNINLIYNYKLNNHISFDASWNFYTGGRASLPLYKMKYLDNDGNEADGVYIPKKNNYRLPPTHLLCIGVNFQKPLKHHVMRTWNISIYNVYNQMNPTFIVYRKNEDSNIYQLQKITLLPIIPSFTLTYEF